MRKVATVYTIQRGKPLLLSVLALLCVVSWWPQSLAAQTVTRGPYLQQGTRTSMVVRWRTNAASNSRVRYSTDQNNLNGIVDNATSTTEHVVTLSGLAPNTKYYYAIGTTTTTPTVGDANHFFFTAPPVGTEELIRIWALGDSGTKDANARAVGDAYLSFTGSQYTHVWLMLGDNAYNDGTDAEYQNAVFNMYPTVLRQTVLWPTLGNHDGHTADSATQTGPYYNIFTLPTQGQAGGVASGTEAYYSFNYGNVHFVVLDSYETSRASNGAMMTWLRNDLLQNTLPWVIAYWHHPPYSKGSHDSDNEIELIEMRQNALPILEQEGVDLVLTGHSHSYERSFLIDGHYGMSSTFTASMKVDGGDGRTEGNGEYEKPEGNTSHDGAVYVVAGSSGQTSGGAFNHPAMYIWLNRLGSLVVDVQGNTMDVLFLSNTGTSLDHFSIIKGPAKPQVTVAATDSMATEAGLTTGTFTVTSNVNTTTPLAVLYGTSGTATAGSDYTALAGRVTIPSGATTATITVTPLNDTLGENDETVIVTLTDDANYTVGSPRSATVTITSDEVPPSTVSVAATDATATEAGLTTGTFTVTRTGATTSALTVFYNTTGTATTGSDYAALSGSVTIPGSAATATITVTPLDDTLVENNETVIVTLATNAAYTVGSPSSATVTLTSDEVTPAVSVAATDATATEAGLTTGTFTVTRTGATTSALTVFYNTTGTATTGSDYAALSGSVTIPSGAASASFTVMPVDDTLSENDETVIATVTAQAAYTVGSPSSATVTISSNDGTPPGITVNLPGTHAYDNKTGKTYRQGGPDGADPLNDLNTLSEEYKLEIESGTGFWWEASYADPTAGNGNPQGVITIHYRSETSWAGTFTVEYYNGSTVLASVNLPVDSRQDSATGKGQKGSYQWDLSAVINTNSELAAARVRFINRASNGKKVWVTHSLLKATF